MAASYDQAALITTLTSDCTNLVIYRFKHTKTRLNSIVVTNYSRQILIACRLTPYPICVCDRKKIAEYDDEHAAMMDKLEHYKMTYEEQHKIQWETRQREEEIVELQKALSDMQVGWCTYSYCAVWKVTLSPPLKA